MWPRVGVARTKGGVMGVLRRFVTVVAAVVLVPLTAVSATAAPPGNDEVEGSLPLTLGAEVTQDTTEATTTPQDTALNANCGAPRTSASVWYSYTPDADRSVVLDVTKSDYSGGALVFEGKPTADSLVACGPGVVGLSTQGGTTYNIMVISDTDVNGGNLVLSLKKAPPPPRVKVSLAKRGSAFRGGAARIRGSYTCAGGTSTVIFGTLVQRVGRLKIPAEFGTEVRCDGRRHNWSARLVSATGIYARGPALAQVTVGSCGIFECAEASAQRRIQLVRVGGPRGRRGEPTVDRALRPRPLISHQEQWHRR